MILYLNATDLLFVVKVQNLWIFIQPKRATHITCDSFCLFYKRRENEKSYVFVE